jgi:hypothetical protein
VPVSPRRTAAADAWGLTDASGPRRGRLTWRPALAACLLRIAASTSWSGSATHCGGPAAGQPRRGDRTGGPVQGLCTCTCTCTGRPVTSPARATSPGQPCRATPRRRAELPVACARERPAVATHTDAASLQRLNTRQAGWACMQPPSTASALPMRRDERALGCPPRIFALTCRLRQPCSFLCRPCASAN